MQVDTSLPALVHDGMSTYPPPTDYRQSVRIGRWFILFDLVVFVLLVACAVPRRWDASRGDLWLDESDYALAAVRGFQANRWDLPEESGADKIIQLRHFHPPLVSHLIGAALRTGRDEQRIRTPSILAGALTVALLYLCGLYLFAPRDETGSGWPSRFISFACALVHLASPAHIRASSHALPWAFITLWLVAIALALAAYAQTRRTAWIVVLFTVLGLLFATSEYVAVAALALVLIAPMLFWHDFQEPARRKPVVLALTAGITAFGVIAVILWPAGLTGGIGTMLRHYVEMANDPWAVVIEGHTYDRAPKWAYYYWYRQLFPAYLGWYLLGFVGLAVLAVARKLSVGLTSVTLLTGVVLAASHRSHIIGPEYLVHALPLMTILGGCIFAALACLHGPTASILALGGAALVLFGPVNGVLSGMDKRSQVPRWPFAAAYLKAHWTRNTRLLAPAFGGGGRWYLIHYVGVHADEWRIQALPTSGAGDKIISEVARGEYTYVINGSTFSDRAPIDPRIARVISGWPRVWKSEEQGTGPSRLSIYRSPAEKRH